MPENESGLFRKSTLERVSSPEQLNEYIKVTNPSLIVMLLGIFTILAAAMVWVFCGGIPNSVELSGVVATNIKGEQSVYCYVPIGTSKKIKQGMAVQISPDYASREEYGYINGTVESIGTSIVTSDTLESNFYDPQIVLPTVSTAMQTGNVVEIKIKMGDWSTEKGESLEITDGTECVMGVVVGETRPIEFVINTNTTK